MVEKRAIDKLTIKGFKTLRDVELELGQLNVLIGPNGAGKSNFVSFFLMLREMAEDRFQVWTAKRGGASRILTFGANQTTQMSSRIAIGDSYYNFTVELSDDDRFVFVREKASVVEGEPRHEHVSGGGHRESHFLSDYASHSYPAIARFCSAIAGADVYHLNDTSDTAAAMYNRGLHDNRVLRRRGENLAAILYKLKHFHLTRYEEILDIVKLALPFFGDFILEPVEIRPDDSMIQLFWRHNDNDYPFLASQLSDGSLRFICLGYGASATRSSLQQSSLMSRSLVCIPTPSSLLGASATRQHLKRMQVIVATQSHATA